MTTRPLLQRYEPDMKYIGSGESIPCLSADPDGECVLYVDHLADRAKLLAEIERLTPWAKMGAWALETSREEMGGLDGGEIQDAALAFGLLHEVEVTEPCCDECQCAEYDDFPQKCLRIRIPFKPIPLPEKGSDE